MRKGPPSGYPLRNSGYPLRDSGYPICESGYSRVIVVTFFVVVILGAIV